ncbi:peptidase M36 fungalysin [Hymenobacter roseosalivarius DSM 11622]|uniref:Peptidase M36 fungalysin n=1 Tax=Hymenobacter roseosalivarius DSM 11622 TaxID=645990 RepID=A0A1W1UV49_9BACT|nr:T9SS-dependent M36 family metallopeptidase [Hymenobacter roseosalivarius]SMB84962.1 peptidase M36 fungalysin [Hymenobacter roseosalivarius DSM 11622]
MNKLLLLVSRITLVVAMLTASGASFGQSSGNSAKKPIPQAALDHLKKNRQALDLADEDLADLVLSSQSTSKRNGLKHLYIQQRYQGIDIYGALTTVNLTKDDQVINVGNRFQKDLGKKVKSNQAKLDAPAAVAAAARHLGLTLKAPLAYQEQSREPNRAALLSPGGISLRPIPAKLLYQPLADGRLVLAWEVSIYELDARNWWNVRVDAATGEFLDKDNLVVECTFENDGPGGKSLSVSQPETAPFSFSAVAAGPTANAYNVFAVPTETPSHGPRVFVGTDVADKTASPMGWHTVTSGVSFTTTRGNNVNAYEDPDNNNNAAGINYSPNPGPSLLFDYPVDFSKQPVTYRDAATTNLFYMSNIMHDIWYQYGFDEVSGNFQTTNPNALEGLGADQVMAESQDSRNVIATRNNANFATPIDGQAPRMQMYLWSGAPDPEMFRVSAPAGIAGTYPAREGSFSKPLTATPLTGKLVLAQSTPPTTAGKSEEGCAAFTNGAAISGNIAVVYRGNCGFADKVQNAQIAGAIAVVVINNVSGGPTVMGGAPTNPTPAIVIPAVMISMEDGQLIRQQLDAAATVEVALKNSGGLPELDGDFDNGIIAHEYGHGISTRLTGGPNNSSCLRNAEQGGEGWSDWFGLMLTMKTGDTGPKPRGIGTYVQNQPTTGRGIRPSPYSTDFGVNNYTYAATNNPVLTQPHGVGFVWATMLWDMTWALIDQYGFDPNLYTGKAGNNLAMQLVIDGLKLQACNPGFVDARDAILAADRANNNGANQKLIWTAFAKRGLGFSAQQGLSTSRSDQVEAFDLPPVYSCTAPTIAVQATSNVKTNGPVTTIYLGYGPQNVQLQANSINTGLVGYTWSPAAGLSNAAVANPVFTPTAAGTYPLTVTTTNSAGCQASATVTITVIDVRCGPNNDQVLVCHSKTSRCLKSSEVSVHINHGDMLGNCGTTTNSSSFAAEESETDSELTSAPNPAVDDKTSVSFTLREGGTFRLEVLNMQGTVVAVLGEGSGKAGQRFTYEFAKGRLTGDLFIAHLITGQGNRFTRLIMKN